MSVLELFAPFEPLCLKDTNLCASCWPTYSPPHGDGSTNHHIRRFLILLTVLKVEGIDDSVWENLLEQIASSSTSCLGSRSPASSPQNWKQQLLLRPLPLRSRTLRQSLCNPQTWLANSTLAVEVAGIERCLRDGCLVSLCVLPTLLLQPLRV
ncbi:hypothetical protein NE237_010750 [Protea cynaroides]|uniref:Uncharacterized protein n=1 Tax=Protea cynaroides TaxID=273540 RepID=A0A9Q0L0E0_9MAGN|nr:hypothetical protein NE237_010750 [Protea cynaroides]